MWDELSFERSLFKRRQQKVVSTHTIVRRQADLISLLVASIALDIDESSECRTAKELMKADAGLLRHLRTQRLAARRGHDVAGRGDAAGSDPAGRADVVTGDGVGVAAFRLGRHVDHAVCTKNLSPDVMMMKSAEHGACSDRSGELNRTRLRNILAQRSVRSDLIIVARIRRQGTAQGRFRGDHNVVEALPGTGWWSDHGSESTLASY
jgi:hypothetical protein